MIGQPGQRITRCLAAQMILKCALFGDVDHDDLVANKTPTVVIDAAAAELGFQSGAVFPSPLHFDRFDPHHLVGPAGRWRCRAEIEDDLKRIVRCQKFLSGCVAEHGYERLVDVEKLSFRIAATYSV